MSLAGMTFTYDFDPDCPNIRTCIPLGAYENVGDAPLCEHCALPYYWENASQSWVHPFEIDDEIIGLEDKESENGLLHQKTDPHKS